jgi:hypothetical protein
MLRLRAADVHAALLAADAVALLLLLVLTLQAFQGSLDTAQQRHQMVHYRQHQLAGAAAHLSAVHQICTAAQQQLLICAYAPPSCLQIADWLKDLPLESFWKDNKAISHDCLAGSLQSCCFDNTDRGNSPGTILPLRCTTQNYDWGVPASQDSKVRPW